MTVRTVLPSVLPFLERKLRSVIQHQADTTGNCGRTPPGRRPKREAETSQ